MILDELRAEGDSLDWLPAGLRGEKRERALEEWATYLAVRGFGAARPRDLFERAAYHVRRNPGRLPPVRIVEPPAEAALAVRRAFEAERDALVKVDLPEIGPVTGAVAKRIGGFLAMQFLSGFRTYIGAAILMLTGAAAVLNALACILQGGLDGSVSAVGECWSSLLVGTGTFGAGMAALGLGGKADKDAAVQIAVAEGKIEAAKAVASGSLPPAAVAGK